MENEKNCESEPSPRRAVLYKVAGSVAAALLYLSLAQKYPIKALEGTNFDFVNFFNVTNNNNI